MAKDKEVPVVNTLVCLTCGAEQFFHSDVPSSLKCQTCGSTVFRTFSTPTKPDEVTESQLEETARSAALGDVSPDTAHGDVRELNNP
jgi:DNA-directed RNA polymerase subunit RPC12/RpoP